MIEYEFPFLFFDGHWGMEASMLFYPFIKTNINEIKADKAVAMAR